MMKKKLSELEASLFEAVAVVCSAAFITECPVESYLERIVAVTLLSVVSIILHKKETSKLTKIFYDLFVFALIMMNRIRTCVDVWRGLVDYNLPKLPSVTDFSLSLFFVLTLMVPGGFIFLFYCIEMSVERFKRYSDRELDSAVLLGKVLLEILIVVYAASFFSITVIRSFVDAYQKNILDKMLLQQYLFTAFIDSVINFMPVMFFGFPVISSISIVCEKKGDFLLTDENVVIKYKGKDKKIYIPRDFKIFFTDTFLECDSSYELWFEEGILEIPPLKFKKTIPVIHYPSSLQNIREYSLFIKGQNPFDNETTVNMLLKNPVFKIIDGCMVNTKTNTLLFVIDHKSSEFKIPESVGRVGRYAFEDLQLSKAYAEKRNPDTDLVRINELKSKYINYSNGSDKEFELFEAETVLKRPQLEKIYLHKNMNFIEQDALNLASGVRELFIPDEADYDIAEMISSGPYVKYVGKGKKITHRMIERLLQIHSKIKSGCYPNSKQLAYDLEASEPTINRDIEYLRDSRGAPIEYDYQNRGYYYTEDYELFFD